MTINLASTQETIRRITTSRLSIMLHSRFQDSLSCSKTLSQKTKTKPTNYPTNKHQYQQQKHPPPQKETLKDLLLLLEIIELDNIHAEIGLRQ